MPCSFLWWKIVNMVRIAAAGRRACSGARRVQFQKARDLTWPWEESRSGIVGSQQAPKMLLHPSEEDSTTRCPSEIPPTTFRKIQLADCLYHRRDPSLILLDILMRFLPSSLGDL